MASCGNKEPLQFSCDKHRQLPLHWVTIPPPPTDTVSAACSISVPSEEGRRGGGWWGWYQFFNPNARYHLWPRGGAAALMWKHSVTVVVVVWPPGQCCHGFRGIGRHANQEPYATAPFSEQAWNDGWRHSVKLSNKLGCGPNAAKTVKVQGFHKSVSKQGIFSLWLTNSICGSDYTFCLLIQHANAPHSPVTHWYFS